MNTPTISIEKFLHNRSINIQGGSFYALTPEELRARGLRFGVKVKGPLNSALLKINLRPGFIITAVDEQPLRSLDQLKQYFEKGLGMMISGIYEDGTHDHYFVDKLS